MTSSLTPNPAIHNVPALDSGAPDIPEIWSQLEAWGQTLLTQIEQWIALALLNVNILGVKPFAALEQFGSEAMGAVSNIDTLIQGVGGTVINDVVNVLKMVQQILNALAVGLGKASGVDYTVGEVQGYVGDLNSNFNNLLNTLFGEVAVAEQLILSVIPFGIPSGNITGVLGPADIGSALQGLANTILQGLQQSESSVTASAETIANIFNGFVAHVGYTPTGGAPDPNSVTAIAQNAAANLAAKAISKPSYMGIDPTADVVFNLASLSGSSPTYVNVTASNSVMGFICCPDGGVKQSVCWLGQSTTNITGVYINVYEVNLTTGALSRVYASPNVMSNQTVSNSLTWNYWDFGVGNFIDTASASGAQANWYAVELAVTGSGTYQVVGIPNHWLGSTLHPSAYPKFIAATRSTTTSVTFGAAGAGNDITGQTGSPKTITFSSGSVTAGDDVFVVVMCNATSPTVTVNYDSTNTNVPMTQIGSFGALYLFRLTGAHAGPVTVSVTASVSSGNISDLAAESISMLNVGSVGTVVTNSGTNSSGSFTASSGAITVPTQGAAIQAFDFHSASGGRSMTGYSANQRYLQNSTAGGGYGFVMGDSETSGSVTITGSVSSTGSYDSIAIPLSPAAAPVPATISTPTYSQNVPWFGLCGIAGVSEIAPQTTQYTLGGQYTYNVPSWMQIGDQFDIVICGDGGGGSGGGTFTTGNGGGAGTWYAITLTYGTDIPLSTKQFTVNVGGGGHPGSAVAGSGGSGAGTTVVIPGKGTLSAAGGSGGVTTGNNAFAGASPGPVVLNSDTYLGGAAQFGQGSGGNAPGGGGAGGMGIGWQGAPTNGGRGAAGAAFITAYQGAGDSGTGGLLVRPPALKATASIPAPTVRGRLSAPKALGTASIPAPVVLQRQKVVAPTLTGAASVPAPVVRGRLTAPTLTGAASISAPVVRGGSPTYDATGTGSAVTNGHATWTHTAAAGADVFVWIWVGGGNILSTVTYGGTPMTVVGASTGYGSGGVLYIYRAQNVSGGQATIVVTDSAPIPVIGNSVSYTSVNSVSTPTQVAGTQPNVSQSATCSPGQTILQAFTAYGGSFTSTSGGTSRYSGSAGGDALVIQDATSSTTFTAAATSSAWLSSVYVILS